MTIEKVSNIGSAKIEIAYERFGSEHAPPVLLIMGLGTQMLSWPDDFCQQLVERGLQVIRFDNRDVGLSSHMKDAPFPDFAAALAGDFSSVSYTLSDLVTDTVGLLDALGLESAHLVGASMGGFIAQTVAIEQPARVRSLTSIMSTTGNPAVGQSKPHVLQALAGPPAQSREQAIERTLANLRLIRSPGFEFDLAAAVARTEVSYDRAYDPLGMLRQAVAIVASGDRTKGLRSIKIPTLVIHGADDLLCDVSGGRATAEAIVGAELVVIDGLGHDLPAALWPRFASLIAAVVERGESLMRT